MRLTPSRLPSLVLLTLLSPSLGQIPIGGPDALDAQSLFGRSPQHARHHSNRGRRPPVQLDLSLSSAWNGASTLILAGTSGVGAMQMSVVDDDHVLFYDKAEGNPLQVNGHSAWGSIYTISTQKLRALNLQTNSFCAGGGWMSNGTLVSIGGNPAESNPTVVGNGFQSIRLFTPCGEGNCDVYEDPANLHLTSNRWYPSSARLEDGSLIILSGAMNGGFNDAASKQNPTIEFFPRKGDGVQIHSQFLADAVPSNLFPITFTLPSGGIFVAANRLAMIYNWKTNTERRLPGLPNGVRVNYPSSAAAVLLPLTIANNWKPEVLICGGTTANVDGNPSLLSALTPASTQCVRMVLDEAGIAGGWIVEQMNSPRVMGDAILTPDGNVLIVNGAKSGVAGYDNVSATGKIGHSNAANPNYTPTLYSPLAPTGSRFSENFPTSSIERLYHSSASLLPDGRIMISGSNPNPAVTTQTYATRYEVEILSPPYVNLHRPVIASLPSNLHYGESISIRVLKSPRGTKVYSAVIMDLGYSTHGVHMNHRLVELVTSVKDRRLIVTGPTTTGIYPPGYAWLYVLADGVPSQGHRIMIGNGGAPPVNA